MPEKLILDHVIMEFFTASLREVKDLIEGKSKKPLNELSYREIIDTLERADRAISGFSAESYQKWSYQDYVSGE